MGKKKDKQKMIEEARQQRKKDKQMKIKLRKKMAKGDSFKLSNLYLSYYSQFDKEVAHLRIKIRDVSGDGNCLFRAFADQVDGNETTHVIMRQQACKYMLEHKQFFAPFLDEDQDGSIEDYIKIMRKNGEWGGHLQLQALSECFKCIVVVHKKQLEEYNIRPMFEEPRSLIHLGYFQHQDFQHYVSIREISDDSELPAIMGLQKLNQAQYGQLMFDDPEEFLMMQQLQEMQIAQIGEEMEEIIEEQQPFPNYPKNKRCKCGSKLDYKHCCFKEWQIRREKKLKNG